MKEKTINYLFVLPFTSASPWFITPAYANWSFCWWQMLVVIPCSNVALLNVNDLEINFVKYLLVRSLLVLWLHVGVVCNLSNHKKIKLSTYLESFFNKALSAEASACLKMFIQNELSGSFLSEIKDLLPKNFLLKFWIKNLSKCKSAS